MILYAGGFSIGIVTGLLLGWWLTLKLYPHPLSREQMRKRGLTECLMCGGMGCYNDQTATHGVGVMVPTGDLPIPSVLDPRLRDIDPARPALVSQTIDAPPTTSTPPTETT